MTSKYAKYSTEQLEGIFNHLTDPEEKELVKKELSSRYYQHYLQVGNGGTDQRIDADAPAPEGLEPAEPQAEEAPHEENEAGDEDPGELAELEPIKLPAPKPPEPAEAAAEKAARKYCFVATAAYGSDMAREVVLLRNYRDQYLSRTAPGRKFIEVYYRLGPHAAELIGWHKRLQLLARHLLAPVILLIKKNLPNSAEDKRNF